MELETKTEPSAQTPESEISQLDFVPEVKEELPEISDEVKAYLGFYDDVSLPEETEENSAESAELTEEAQTETDVAENKNSGIGNICNLLYVFVVMVIFLNLFVHMVFFPRSKISERENRKLASFPSFTLSSFIDGSFTSGINVYFSDTVPGRDELTAEAVAFKDKGGFRVGGVKIHNAKPVSKTEKEEIDESEPVREIKETQANVNVEDNATLGNNGIIVAGTRGLMIFGGNKSVGKQYAEITNEYKRKLGEDVNVYCVPIPTSIEFYCPPSYKEYTNSELESINNILGALDGVKGVDVYTTLSKHSNEDIYFRTDHHWAALGAYYAAESFAKVAKVDFPKISEYEKVTKKGFVGTLYNYSNDIVLKENPEDFVYYKPKNVNYKTTYYPMDSMNKPTEGEFFYEGYEDGSPLMYGTFMGGDDHITHVHTDVDNDRRLVIFKDSYGNAFSSFMLCSFEDVYVIDMRYFKLNALDFMKKYKITDVAFVNNIFHADTQSTVNYYKTFLTQKNPESDEDALSSSEPDKIQESKNGGNKDAVSKSDAD